MPLDADRNYIPPSVSGFYPGDLYNQGASNPQVAKAQLQPKFTTRVVDRLPEGEIVFWRMLLEDTRGGLNMTNGRFEEDHDRVSGGDADTRFYRTLLLPQKTATQTEPLADVVGIHGINLFNRLIVAGGSVTDDCLYVETSATNPALSSQTFNPDGSISGLAGVVIGGATQPMRLAVCMTGGAAKLLNSSFATAGTFHTDTNPTWGMIQTFINDDLILIYANGQILGLDKTSAITDQPLVLLQNVPNGGYAVGLAKLAGAPVRAIWVWPYENNTAGMLAFGSESPGRVISMNLEGNEYYEIPMGLKYTKLCATNGSALAVSDGERVVYYDGRTQARDIGWLAMRESDSNYVYECRGLAFNGSEIWMDVNLKLSANASGVTSLRYFEIYNVETNSFHAVSARHTSDAATGSFSALAPNIPISQTTGFAHVWQDDGEFDRTFVPVFGYNPHSLYRQTSGTGASTGNEYEASATYRSPKWELPGLEGWPKLVKRILFMGDVDSGGTDATSAKVTVTAGNMTAEFSTGFEDRAQIADISDNNDLFYKLQVTVELERTTANTRFTPNGLPIIVEGYAFVGNVEPPNGYQYDIR